MNRDLLVFLVGLSLLISLNKSFLNSFFKKSDYGSLIFDVGRLEKKYFWWGIFVIIALIIVSVFQGIIETPNILSWERTPTYLTGIVYLISWGLSHIELREKGIVYRFKLIRWSAIKYYKWELNLLIINLKYNKELRFLIPVDYRDYVEQIISEYLQKKPSYIY